MAAKVKRIEGRVRSNLHLDLMPRSWRGVRNARKRTKRLSFRKFVLRFAATWCIECIIAQKLVDSFIPLLRNCIVFDEIFEH